MSRSDGSHELLLVTGGGSEYGTPSTVYCTVPSCESAFFWGGGFPRRSPTEKARTSNPFQGELPFPSPVRSVSERGRGGVVRVRFRCSLGSKTNMGNTGRTVLGHHPSDLTCDS